MDELYGRLYEALGRLHRLRLGDLFPEMTKKDCMTLLAIDHFNKEKEDGLLTVSELAAKTHTKPSAVSRTLKNLEEHGLIERTVNRDDRRNTYVTVSAEGKEMWKRMEATVMEFARAVFARMDAQDVENLISYINRFAKVAEEEIERLKPGGQNTEEIGRLRHDGQNAEEIGRLRHDGQNAEEIGRLKPGGQNAEEIGRPKPGDQNTEEEIGRLKPGGQNAEEE